jgi:ABC-2 type transport system permease protein
MANDTKTSVMSADSSVTLSPCHPVTLSSYHALRAWCFLVWLCFLRLARLRQMVGIALAVLVLMATVVGLTTYAGRGGMEKWQWGWPGGRWPRPPGYIRLTFEETARGMQLLPHVLPESAAARALQDAVAGASATALKQSRFYLFSNWFIFSIFLGFLLPILSLSFATEALSGEREGRTLTWLLIRPLSRWSIYLAKFVALLPWSVGLNVGGFALLCVLAGSPGRLAFRLYWPAVFGGTIAFCALFHLMAACSRRAAVVALVYSFFLETILGSMPGSMKRISLSFYTRCLMFEAAAPYGVHPDKPSIYHPVDSMTAWSVLLAVTVVLLVVGMVIFARSEYQDLA